MKHFADHDSVVQLLYFCGHDFSGYYFETVMFLLSSFVICQNFMLLSLPVLELEQFSFITDLPDIQNWKFPGLSFSQYLQTGKS